ncbi:MAG: glycoside hydrolase domain-containing protein, partial [Gelidibacter sp.]
VTPGGVDEYVIGSPLFKKATLYLENGNTFEISSKNNSEANVYIESANLNGKPYNNTFIKFDDLQKGGVLQFNMGKTPNKKWGTAPESVPYSLSTSKK